MDRWCIVDTYYWWLAEHHTGQWSREYRRLSKVTGYFKPGMMQRGPDHPECYRVLCERAGCTHEAREEN